MVALRFAAAGLLAWAAISAAGAEVPPSARTVAYAQVLYEAGRLEDAEKLFREALAAIDAKKLPQKELGRCLRPLIAIYRAWDRQDEALRAALRYHEIVAGSAPLDEWTRTQILGENAAGLAEILTALGRSREAKSYLGEAIRLKRRLLEIKPVAEEAEARIRKELGNLYAQAQNPGQARLQLERALQIQRQLAAGSLQEAELLCGLAAALNVQGFREEARQNWRQAASLYSQLLTQAEQDKDARAVMELLRRIQGVYQQTGQYLEAIAANRRLLAILEQRFGEEHPLTCTAKSDLGGLYGAVQYYDTARPLLVDALQSWRNRNPPAPLCLARALNDLAVVERATGSLVEAQALFTEALEIRKTHLAPDDLRLAYSFSNLASVFSARGDYARAIVLYDRAIGIYRARGSVADDLLSNSLLNVAMTYKSQGQLDPAARYCLESLEVCRRVFGADAPQLIPHYNALASMEIGQGQLDRAAEYNRRAFEICRQRGLEKEPIVAEVLHQLASLEYLRDELEAAEKHWQQAMEIQQASGHIAAVARTLNYLGRVATLRGDPQKAEQYCRRAMALEETVQVHPAVEYLTCCNLAEILHGRGEVQEALQLLQKAVQVVETPRVGTVGAEAERARNFARFASAFDLLVAWSLAEGQLDDAFRFADRSRNRTFLDQLSLAGVDLRDTLTSAEGESLRQRERDLQTRLGSLRARAADAARAADPAERQLARQLDAARRDYAAGWTEIRNASPFYRGRPSAAAPLDLPAVRRYVAQSKAVLLFYYLGSEQSHLLVLGDPEKVHVHALQIPAALAKAVSVEPGSLTRSAAVQLVRRYVDALSSVAGGRGLGGVVTSPKGDMPASWETMLAEALLPVAVRSTVAQLAPDHIIIVPDGALHQLPFEALLLESQPQPRYLLDAFPPISYAPSAAILINLDRREIADPKLPMRVLSVGNPQYAVRSGHGPQQSLAAVSRGAFTALGGSLSPLPGTSKECALVAEAFGNGRVTVLEAEQATERNVREHLAGCRFLHLAAHGLVDLRYDNLFGAIALTPAEGSDAAENDGFLSLHEIHALGLSGCEIAVLSACRTNVGSDRPLEAGSTLAQAFLAAGTRRAVCSHWSVDDASTAALIGGFCRRVARSTADGRPADYARALHEAQRELRAQSQWSAPYYWAPFVLIGPAR